MKNRLIKYVLLLAFLSNILVTESFSQDHSAAFAAADSSFFSVNVPGGWKLFNSHMSLWGTDSVQLELTVQHENTINWREEQFAGKIKTAAFIPRQVQTVLFNLMTDIYALRIDQQGKCFLRMIQGPDPDKQVVVIPVKLSYKK